MTPLARDTAYSALASQTAALYRLLGSCPAPWMDTGGLAALTDLNASEAEQLAAALVDASLVDAVDGGYSLSPAGHLHARVTADEHEDGESSPAAEALDRYFTYLNECAAAAERLITPSHRQLWSGEAGGGTDTQLPFALTEPAALDWLARQLPSYMAVIRFASLDHRYPLVCDLAHHLWPLFLRRRYPAERNEALALGLAAATVMRHDTAVGQMLTSLAGALRGTLPAEAYGVGRRAVSHYQASDDTLGLAQALDGLAKSLFDAGHLDRAEQYFRDAEQLRSGLGYIRGTALSRQGRGRVALAGDNPSAADELLASAHQLLLQEGDSYDASMTLIYHAEALAALGDIDGALSELETASAALEKATSSYGQARAWEIKAQILDAAGRGGQAEVAKAKARELRARSGEPDFAFRA